MRFKNIILFEQLKCVYFFNSLFFENDYELKLKAFLLVKIVLSLFLTEKREMCCKDAMLVNI
jgi:hypothetical protein